MAWGAGRCERGQAWAGQTRPGSAGLGAVRASVERGGRGQGVQGPSGWPQPTRRRCSRPCTQCVRHYFGGVEDRGVVVGSQLNNGGRMVRAAPHRQWSSDGPVVPVCGHRARDATVTHRASSSKRALPGTRRCAPRSVWGGIPMPEGNLKVERAAAHMEHSPSRMAAHALSSLTDASSSYFPMPQPLALGPSTRLQ